MNNYFIKITGKVNIPIPITIGHNYKLVADCSVVSEQKNDNENGEFDIIYKMIPITLEVAKDNGEFIKAKDPRRNSEKFRKYLWKLWSESEAVTMDFDDIYEKVTYKAMAELPQILREVIKELK